MSGSHLVKIEFCFPSMPRNVKDNKGFVRLLLNQLRKSGSIECAGYLKDEDLYDHFLSKIGKVDFKNYKLLSGERRQSITKVIHSTVRKCHEKLPLALKPLFIFVFPWFPGKDDEGFEGVMGITPYFSTFHLFISINDFSKTSLVETIAHELNHTIFFYYHSKNLGKYTLLDNLIIEGLAENFREEVTGGKSAPWSRALTKKEALRTFDSIRSLLRSKSPRIRNDVLFGSKHYKRWAGYSIGYWLIKEFRKKHQKGSWEEIMHMDPEDMLGFTEIE